MKKLIPIFILTMLVVPILSFAQPATGVGGQNPGAGVGGQNQTGGGTNNTTGGTVPSAPVAQAKLENPLKGVNSLGDLFYKVINALISVSYVVIALFLLYSGFKFVTAQGSSEKLGEAKQTLYNTLIGAALIIGAKTIVEIVRSVISGLNS